MPTVQQPLISEFMPTVQQPLITFFPTISYQGCQGILGKPLKHHHPSPGQVACFWCP